MSRFLVIVSTTMFLGLASPVALAEAPSDQGPQVRTQQLELAAWKKKKKPSSSGSKPSQARPAPSRPAPRHATTPGQQPAAQRPAPQQAPAAQRPAPQQAPSAQRPAPQQAPAAQRPAPQQAPTAQQAPARQAPTTARPTTSPTQQAPATQARPNPSNPQARPSNPAQGQVHSQVRPTNPGSATPSARPGSLSPPSAVVHRSVSRNPANNIAGATRHANNALAHQAQGGQQARAHQNNNHAAAHQQRVARAHAKARHAQAARHRHHAHSSWARRAYYARHHRHHHGWGWWYRPWRSHHSYYGPWYHPHWSYGVFIYGSSPAYHTVYVADQPTTVEEAPERKVDRAHKWAVGIRGGSYVSGYQHGPGFYDFGMGITGRYRASEALGFEAAWAHHDQTWTETTERWSEPFAASVQLFAWPWTRFNPYLSAGITWTQRSYRDSYTDRYGTHQVSEDHVLFGPHGGLGLELGLGDNASVNVEGRLIGYLNVEEDDRAVPSAVQTTAGVNLYF